MKRLVKTVELSFFQDDANGEFGLTHKDTQDNNYGSSFNAFWGGVGIFHDVFEHSHEYQNKYFRGDNAMNIGGEMSAMGSMWYYYNVLGMYNRLNNNTRFSPSEIMKRSTLDMVEESISEGYTQFGYVLESGVPKQKPVYDGDLEYEIADFWKKVKATQVRTDYEQERESGIEYKKSVTFRKIADLHRYGFRMAEKLVPDNHDNACMCIDFLNVWENFCKSNNAEEMSNAFRGVTFKIYKENDRITWKATFHSADRFMYQDVTLTPETIQNFCLEDAYVIDENY